MYAKSGFWGCCCVESDKDTLVDELDWETRKSCTHGPARVGSRMLIDGHDPHCCGDKRDAGDGRTAKQTIAYGSVLSTE